MKTSLTLFNNSLAHQKAGFNELKEGFKQLGQNVKATSKAFQDEIKNVIKELNKDMEQTFVDIKNNVEIIMKENNKVLNKQVAELDQQMQEEIKRVVESMANHLTALSGKFVNDYSPLTDKLRRLIEIANEIERRGDVR